MVNRYDSPAQAQFIDTYVPIPFEQLYTLGKLANDKVDKAINELNTAREKFGEFRSRSQQDMKDWYDATTKPIMPYINQMAANPDLIKDASFRSKLSSAINSVDTAFLSTLKQNAANFDEYKKMEQTLMLQGKGNPLWHNKDFSNYSTRNSGLFDETPIPYMSINELSKPYMDQLKPGYIETKGGYDYFGNTIGDLETIANKHLNDILITPQAQMHMQQYMNATGATKEQAVEWLRQSVVDSNMDRVIRTNREINPYAAMQFRDSLSNKGKKGTEQENQLPQSRNMEIESSMGLRKRALIESQLGKDISDGMTEKEITDAYSSIWKGALEKGDMNAMKKLIDYNSIHLGEETRYLIDPKYDPKNSVDITVGKSMPKKSQFVGKGAMVGAVAFNRNGVPVEEISTEYLLNNDANLLGTFTKYLNTSGTIKEKLDDARSNYGNIINDLLTSADYQFVPDGTVLEYERTGGMYPFSSSMLVKGKAYISEDELDAVLEANKGRYGNLDASDIKNLLFKKGISGKHLIGEEKEVKINNDSEASTYYEINVGIPFDEPAKRNSFDNIYSSDIFGGSNSYKQYGTHTNVAFDVKYNGKSNIR